jgi:hypothetical protein
MFLEALERSVAGELLEAGDTDNRVPSRCVLEFVWRGLRLDEDIGSGREVNRFVSELLGESLTSVDFAHGDLTGRQMRRKSGPSVIAAAASQASNASTRAEIGTADRQPDLCAARVLIVLAPGADKARRRPSGAQFVHVWSPTISLGGSAAAKPTGSDAGRVIRRACCGWSAERSADDRAPRRLLLDRRRRGRLIPAKVQVVWRRYRVLTARFRGSRRREGGDCLRGGLQSGLAVDRAPGGEAHPGGVVGALCFLGTRRVSGIDGPRRRRRQRRRLARAMRGWSRGRISAPHPRRGAGRDGFVGPELSPPARQLVSRTASSLGVIGHQKNEAESAALWTRDAAALSGPDRSAAHEGSTSEGENDGSCLGEIALSRR